MEEEQNVDFFVREQSETSTIESASSTDSYGVGFMGPRPSVSRSVSPNSSLSMSPEQSSDISRSPSPMNDEEFESSADETVDGLSQDEGNFSNSPTPSFGRIEEKQQRLEIDQTNPLEKCFKELKDVYDTIPPEYLPYFHSENIKYATQLVEQFGEVPLSKET